MLYPEWKAPVLPDWVNKAPKGIRQIMASRFSHHRAKVTLCEQDGIAQIAPIVASTEKSPAELRKELGKAVWKKIHHASPTTNARRAYLWMYDLGMTPFSEIVEYRPCHLYHMVGLKTRFQTSPLMDCHVYSAKFAPPRLFRGISDMYQDAERMGVTVNPAWSITRLKREHDAAALRDAISKTSDDRWAEPSRYEVDDLLFVRLVSDRDLSVEGLMQRHCVASYSGAAKTGKLFVFGVSGDERATFAFWESGDICDLKGFANSAPSARMRRASKALMGEVLKTPAKKKGGE
ncbi:PcfJ domain-containing protein [Salipiger thiooxidans]|uniref:PcfJ domain-containing protein n=1 Tax=Salipiger thiooxidans TaxID=282683 RepID=UPI001CFB473A|nr:PcfJ domain-containing protein [Salipiger thiooxidans]